MFRTFFYFYKVLFILETLENGMRIYYKTTRMWANAQRDGRPAERKKIETTGQNIMVCPIP